MVDNAAPDIQVTIEPTWEVRIYISGPIEQAKQLLRQECMRLGLCVTVAPVTFVYSGGEEAGYVVGLLNYPRFPAAPPIILDRAHEIARLLLVGTFQKSALIVTQVHTHWLHVDQDQQDHSSLGEPT